MSFDRLRAEKWRVGRAERGNREDAPFKGDAAAEAMEECEDLANYYEQMLVEKRITQCEFNRVYQLAREIHAHSEALLLSVTRKPRDEKRPDCSDS